MDPLETLTNEHGLIRQYLDNLSMAADRIENGQYPSEAFFEKALDFARSFADNFHHFKEEHVLFVRVAEKKQGELDAQLDALRLQHDRGRELLSGISSSLDGYVARDPMQIAKLLENMAAYGALLRHHIHLEDHVFYPAARKTLDQNELEGMVGEFEKQREKHGGDAFERYHKLVVDMGSIVTHLR
jgi:hemerythrin-like domain-containing protein